MTQLLTNKNGLMMMKPGKARKFFAPIRLLVYLLIPFFLTACAPVIGKTQPIQMDWISLVQGASVGQTFVANYDGLSGMQIMLAPQTSGDGKISLHLRSDAQSSQDIATTSFLISKVNAPGIYSFFFTPQNTSRRQYYYIQLDVHGSGSIQVGAAAGNTYLDGAAYESTTAVDRQLSFHLVYSIRRLAVGLLREFANWLGVIIVTVFIFVLPGWGLFRLFWSGWDSLSLMEKLGISAGASLVIYPIFLLWTSLVGLHIGWLYAWIPPVAALGILLGYHRGGFTRPAQGQPNFFVVVRNRLRSIRLPSGVSLVLFIVIGLVIFSRFWAIRTLDVPMWGDSYQHTVITQLIVDNNGLFRSWQPYAALNTFTYHFGFHSAAAVFHWVTGLSVPRSVLWVGQILNILAVVSLYPLALKISRNRWSGVVALTVAGLLAPVPMSYSNWGRYTQLAGQVVLATAIYLLWSLLIPQEDLDSPSSPTTVSKRRYGIALTAIVMGGLALTHFRVIIFAVIFLVAIYLWQLLGRINRQQWGTLILKTIWIGIGGGIIFLPWFINVFGGKILRNFSNQLTTPASAIPLETQSYNAVGSLLQYLPIGIWLLLPISIAWGLWKQHKSIALVSLWGFLLLIGANPAWLRLPGTGALSNFAIFIAVYIPAGLLIGGAFGLLVETYLSGEWRADLSVKLSNGWRANLLRLGIVGVRPTGRNLKWVNGIIGLIVLGVAFLGLPQRLNDLQPARYSLATRPDLRAASWIKDNVSPDATFLVNSFFAYGGSLIVGSDGGWWLPVLTQRHTNLPPLNYGTEQGIQLNYKKNINQLAKVVQEIGPTDPSVLQMLRDNQITHVYIGQMQGRVNYTGPGVLDPNQMVRDPDFKVIYHQDRVWIFAINQVP